MRGIKEKVALVTGAGGGIGKEIVTHLIEEGAYVIATDVDSVLLDQLHSQVASELLLLHMADLTRQHETEDLVTMTHNRFQRIDVLVNNAGRTRVRPFVDTSEDTWSEIFDLDVFALMRCCQLVLPAMCENRSGRIINIASDVGRMGLPNQTVYASAKGAVLAFTRSLAREVAECNVLVNAVAPGPVYTRPLARQFARRPEFERQLINEIPMKRVAQPDEVADAVLYLASDHARYVTGQTLSVNGGWLTV